jgi:hypothetical protein
MTHDEAIAKVNREGQQSHIEQIFYTVYENICSVYGGEDKIEPFHLADIRGSLTRAKAYALIPSEDPNGEKTTILPDAHIRRTAGRPSGDGSEH